MNYSKSPRINYSFLAKPTVSPTRNLIGWRYAGSRVLHSSSPCWVDRSPKMSLLLLLKACSNLRGKSDRIARVTFRGMLWKNFVILWAVNGFERFLRLLVWRKRSLDGSLRGRVVRMCEISPSVVCFLIWFSYRLSLTYISIISKLAI